MLVQAKQQVADAEASFRAHETANAGEDVLVISRDVLDKARIRLTLLEAVKADPVKVMTDISNAKSPLDKQNY